MYYSTQDTLTPAKVGACAVILHVALNVILLFGFGRYLWNASPALASSLAAYFNFAALFLIFRGRYGSLGSAAIFSSLGKMALCAVAMSAACFAALQYSHLATLEHFLAKAAWLAVIIVVSSGIYFALAWALRCEELPELFLLLRRAEANPASGALDAS
jgi:peptidoglycan biosynthesis protein MviN/MurJ (putative lipid II flippase)